MVSCSSSEGKRLQQFIDEIPGGDQFHKGNLYTITSGSALELQFDSYSVDRRQSDVMSVINQSGCVAIMYHSDIVP